jgi:hypothetical protein
VITLQYRTGEVCYEWAWMKKNVTARTERTCLPSQRYGQSPHYVDYIRDYHVHFDRFSVLVMTVLLGDSAYRHSERSACAEHSRSKEFRKMIGSKVNLYFNQENTIRQLKPTAILINQNIRRGNSN